MIRSFRRKDTQRLFDDWDVARRKLLYLHRAARLDDSRMPPGNRLESLKGEHAGQWSIRINDQWRVCSTWDNGDVLDVEIVD